MEFIGRFIKSVFTEKYPLHEDLSYTGGTGGEEKKKRKKCTFIGILEVAGVERGNVLIST